MKYQMAASGKALLREGLGGRRVSFDGMFAMPLVHRTHRVDISISTLSLNFAGPDNPLIAKDQQLFDLSIVFHLRVNDNQQDVLDAAAHFGVENLKDFDNRIPELINDAEQLVRTAAGELSWAEINDSPTFIEAILRRTPNGYFKPGLIVDNIAIDHADKFPPEFNESQDAIS